MHARTTGAASNGKFFHRVQIFPYLGKRIDQIKTWSSQRRCTEVRRICELEQYATHLAHSLHNLNRLSGDEERGKPWQEMYPLVLDILELHALLRATLDHALIMALAEADNSATLVNEWYSANNSKPFWPGLCAHRLRQLAMDKGHCPNVVEEATELGIDVLRFMVFKSEMQYKSFHSGCGSARCVAYNVNPERYRPPHRPPKDCRCPNDDFVKVPLDELLHCLETDAAPIVEANTGSEDAPPTLKMVPLTKDLKFVAVSHV